MELLQLHRDAEEQLLEIIDVDGDKVVMHRAKQDQLRFLLLLDRKIENALAGE